MSTIVFLHAHPDDEALLTGGTMAEAAARGHRVLCVYATNGDHGEVPDDLGDETLVARRRREAEASNARLGTAAVHWLGHRDSGMTGWEQNAEPDAFANADVDAAARPLAALLAAEGADVLVGYDSHGGYGHPDHVQVHRVARRAAELAEVRLLEATMNRDLLRRLLDVGRAAGLVEGLDPDQAGDDGNPIGTPEAELQWQVDVARHVAAKRAALACHASQTSDVGFFSAFPDEVFAAGFGAEFYLEPGLDQRLTPGWPFDADVAADA